MPTITQRNFSSGELTPALHSRVDLTRYHSGLKTCRNFTILRHGGVANRPGTRFIARAKTGSQSVRLIEFVFSREDTYVLEFGPLYIRFFRNGQQVMDRDVPLEIASPYSSAMLANLNYAQSADVLVICHPDVHPKELQRHDDGWRLVDSRVLPDISPPNTPSTTARVDIDGTMTTIGAFPKSLDGSLGAYVVTAIDNDTLEESLASDASLAVVTGGTPVRGITPNVDTPIRISWLPADGEASRVREYNVYKIDSNGVFSLLGITTRTSFNDIGQPVDSTVNPPEDREVFKNNEYPSTVTFHQQRLYYGNTNRRPGRILASKIGKHRDFSSRRNIQADDPLDFEIAGRQVSRINSLVGLDQLLVLTDSGEFTIRGEGGAITPTTLNARPETYFGASELIRPLIVGRSAIFAQRGDSIVRDFRYDFSSGGYEGNDLTVFSSHLFDGHRLVDAGYIKAPNNNIWLARDDNKFLCLTYIREQELVGWTQCDFENGRIVSMAGLPEEDDVDRLYVAVQRGDEIHIERMADRTRDDIFLDSAVVFDGRNNDRAALNISTDTNRGRVTLIINSPEYNPIMDVTDARFCVTLPDGSEVVFDEVRDSSIDNTSSSFITETVQGMTHQELAMLLHENGIDGSINLYDWSFKTRTCPSTAHLGDEKIGVYADGFVLNSPNNPSYAVRLASETAPFDRYYSYIVAGLPITSDLETLSVDSPDNAAIRKNKKLISSVRVDVLSSRGIWVGAKAPEGNGVDGLNEAKVRSDEGYNEPVRLKTGTVEVNIKGEWNGNGSVFVRQVDPLPLTVSNITPSGYMGG